MSVLCITTSLSQGLFVARCNPTINKGEKIYTIIAPVSLSERWTCLGNTAYEIPNQWKVGYYTRSTFFKILESVGLDTAEFSKEFENKDDSNIITWYSTGTKVTVDDQGDLY